MEALSLRHILISVDEREVGAEGRRHFPDFFHLL